MSKSFVLSLAGVLVLTGIAAQAQNFRVVNAASYQDSAAAPGSIVTIFGGGLTGSVAAVTDPSRPPTTLGGTTVSIGGTAAGLFYVSPVQINAVVPASAKTGVQPMLITSAAGTVAGTVTIDPNAQPGLFSLRSSGTHDGAIIDALTGRIGAFSVNTGTKSTFLSVYLTGLNPQPAPVVRIGGVAVPVTFAGASPCCAGLQQINLALPAALAGAGRVPVVVQAGAQTSNVVEIVILPALGHGQSKNEKENQTRSRELAAIASIPGTSLALVADENDDVVRQINIASRSVVRTISLPSDAEPAAIAVNAAGTLAVVAERNRAKVAILDLSAFNVRAEIPVGSGPVGVAITGNTALVVNGDGNSVTFLDLAANTAIRTIPVGSGPRGVAVDNAGHAWVTNQNDGTLSAIDVGSRTVLTTIPLVGARPAAIQLIAGTSFAVVTDPATNAEGRVLVVNLGTGAVTSFNVNPDRSGGAADVVVAGATAYIANQTAGSVAILPLTISGSLVTGTSFLLNVGLGVRALAIDVRDNALLAANQSTGSVAVVSLVSNQVIARINGISAEADDDGDDDHNDHDRAKNLPAILSVVPGSAKAGTTVNLTIAGTNLQGASAISFVSARFVERWDDHGKGAGPGAAILSDPSFTVTNLQANATGTQLTATVSISASASAGIRLVRVSTPNGDSSFTAAAGAFIVLP